ncbi:MAG: DUF1343 domain-containing protein [Clostridia bacterium]|nr:DUF1343 domain-containing protein [Clostridia bacterium]
MLNTEAVFNMLSGKRLGLISNSKALLKNGKAVATVINEKYNLYALFSGEHGFNTQKQAGGFDNEVFTENETGVPVYDLFGGKASLEKAEEIFKCLDCVLFDIQDIGTRYYTYQYTLLDALYLCQKTSTELIVLDRMNPLGCNRVEGNLLEKDCISEVGRVAGQPTVTGLTIGEITLWYNYKLNINASINIIACEGVTRDLKIENTDLSFTPPSPNLKSIDALFLYVGTCLFEGTNLSEGRGTDKPFEMFGAPWLEPKKVIDYLYYLPDEEKSAFKGLEFLPCTFTPTFSDYKNELCNGIQIEIKDKNHVNMFETGLQLIKAIKTLYPDKVEFSEHLGNLAGTKEIYMDEFNPHQYIKTQETELEKFKNERKSILIY